MCQATHTSVLSSISVLLSLSTCMKVTVVVLCVCVSVTALAATYLVYMSKVRQYTVSCRLLKTYIVWTPLKMFGSGYMALFACHDDWRLSSFSTKTHQWFLTITQGIVYEPLGRNDDYLN